MAHYDKRPFSKCILCQRATLETGPLTKEHLFGKAVAKAIPTIGNYQSCNMKGSSPMSNITLKALCTNCNNEVLGTRRMQPVSDNNSALFSGSISTISKAKLPLVHQYFIRLGILIDIATSNYDIESENLDKLMHKTQSNLCKFPPLISNSERKKFLKNFQVPSISVQIAHYIDDNSKEGNATVRSIYLYDKEKKLPVPAEKEFVMVNHKLAFILRIGERKSLGAYPNFKILPPFYYKEFYKLAKINHTQALNIYKNTIGNGPKRSKQN